MSPFQSPAAGSLQDTHPGSSHPHAAAQPGSPGALRSRRKLEPSLRCPVSPLDRGGVGLLSAKRAKLGGMSESGCPYAKRGPEDSRDGEKWGISRGVELLILLGFSGILEDEVQLFTWLQVGVNMLQLLFLTTPDFCTVRAFFWAFWVFSPIEQRSHHCPVLWSFWGDRLNNAHKKGFESTRREAKEDKML